MGEEREWRVADCALMPEDTPSVVTALIAQCNVCVVLCVRTEGGRGQGTSGGSEGEFPYDFYYYQDGISQTNQLFTPLVTCPSLPSTLALSLSLSLPLSLPPLCNFLLRNQSSPVATDYMVSAMQTGGASANSSSGGGGTSGSACVTSGNGRGEMREFVDVWASNLEQEFVRIREVVRHYPYVAMVSQWEYSGKYFLLVL